MTLDCPYRSNSEEDHMMPDLHVLWLRGLGKYVHEIRVVRYGRRVSTKPAEKNTRKNITVS